MMDRRQFLRAALFVAAAPMIVKASSLMALPVRPKLRYLEIEGTDQWGEPMREVIQMAGAGLRPIYGDLGVGWREVTGIRAVPFRWNDPIEVRPVKRAVTVEAIKAEMAAQGLT